MLQDCRTATVDITRSPAQGRLFLFLGPATLVSVGYMDPGNWATDLEGGARFGYSLLWVLVLSNAMALLLQTLSARLGVASGMDLAQACRACYGRKTSFALWVLAELAIIACDLAEVLGSAIALNLLFGIPLLWGAVLTLLGVFLILALQRRGVRALEAAVLTLVLIIALCLAGEMWLVKPWATTSASDWAPGISSVSLYIAIGILGATVMPHNLYLHSSLVQTRRLVPGIAAKREALRYYFIDTAVALNLALLVNAAILILAASVFWQRGMVVDDIRDAHQLLAPLLGGGLAALLFAVALLASGQSSTITGTLAGQIVMEGFLRIRLPPVVRSAMTRLLAVTPAVIVLALFGDAGTLPLLIASQVVLSLQLPFAVLPLLRLTASESVMGVLKNPPWVNLLTSACALLILAANTFLLWQTAAEWQDRLPALMLPAALMGAAGLALLVHVARVPLKGVREA